MSWKVGKSFRNDSVQKWLDEHCNEDNYLHDFTIENGRIFVVVSESLRPRRRGKKMKKVKSTK